MNQTLSPEFLERPATAAHAIARTIAERGLTRVYSLPGGHMKPLWDELDRAGVRIVSTRHEVAAVHMAQADADLTSELAVAIVTTGPGLTNAVTGIACANLAGTPLLVISAVPPAEQAGMGALEEIDQAGVVRPVTRYARSVSEPRHVLPALDAAIAAAIGEEGPTGVAYLDLTSDALRRPVPPPYEGDLAFRPRRRAPAAPTAEAVEEAAALIAGSRRPLVVVGRGARRDADALLEFIAATGALCVDTREGKGVVPDGTEGFVPAARGQAMTGADLIITIGRALDFELAYGSPSVYMPGSKFLRIGRTLQETGGNRRGDSELRADPGIALAELLRAGARPSDPDTAWRKRLVDGNAGKVERLREQIAAEPLAEDGLIDPRWLLATVSELVMDDTIVVADGGDLLAFARVALKAPTYLDLGPFGCLGVGVPFANGAALTCPDRQVIAVIGDGAFGFNALEVETAVREGAPALFVVANNNAWNIERQDQVDNYEGRVIGTELTECTYSELARSLGAHGETVSAPDDVRPALDRAMQNLPALVEVRVTRTAISPDTRSGLASVPDLQAVKPWDDAERRWLRANEPEGDGMTVRPHEIEGRERPRGYSDVTSGGGVAAIAGQLPAEEVLEAGGGMAEQFSSAMDRFVEALGAVNAGPDDILSMRLYVTSAEEYRSVMKELGPVFQRTFDAQYPAMTLLEVPALIDPRAKVEIEGLAVKP